jgi:hypothetical protein
MSDILFQAYPNSTFLPSNYITPHFYLLDYALLQAYRLQRKWPFSLMFSNENSIYISRNGSELSSLADQDSEDFVEVNNEIRGIILYFSRKGSK